MSQFDIVNMQKNNKEASGSNGMQNVNSTEKHAEKNETVERSPLCSPQDFDAYCRQVQDRLARYARERTAFLNDAYERLTQLLNTARAVDDAALSEELCHHRNIVHSLLEAISKTADTSEAFQLLSPSWQGIAPSAKPQPGQPAAGQQARPSPIAPATSSLISPSLSTPVLPSVVAPQPSSRLLETAIDSTDLMPMPMPMPRLPRQPVRPLVDIEADALRLRAEVREWNNRYPLTTSTKQLNIPNALRLRAVACRQRRLEEEGGDTEVAEVTELNRDIVYLLDQAGDQEYTVALDYDMNPSPTAHQWTELSERYEEIARAQEAFEWWLAHRSMITVTDVQPLAESVAAIQQRFNRLLFRIGARDPFQQQLFDDLRLWAKEAQCYLYSLRPKVPIAELVEKASELEAAWEQAQAPVRVLQHRQQTVEDLIALVSQPDFGADPALDEQRLQEALMRCREAHVPASDRRLRDTLLPWAAFLEGDERFRETLREINLEWERRQEVCRMEPAELEPDDMLDALSGELEAVRTVTRGKRCLLLGGTCREENRRKIEEALQLSELVWPSTKPSDPLSKFDTELRHSDIVALLTRFSRKEWKNAADICARDGKKFVHLTTGYGVSQVVRHFYTQIAPQAVENRG